MVSQDLEVPGRMRSCKSQTACLPFSFSVFLSLNSFAHTRIITFSRRRRAPPPQMVYSPLKVFDALTSLETFSLQSFNVVTFSFLFKRADAAFVSLYLFQGNAEIK